MNYTTKLIILIISLTLAGCGSHKKILHPLDECSAQSYVHKDNIEVFVAPLNEFECAELFPGYHPLMLTPAVQPIQITINNNRDSAIVFAHNKTNLETISPEHLYALLKSSPVLQAGLGALINGLVMSIAAKNTLLFLIAINPLAWIQLGSYALFSSEPLRAAAGILALCATLPPMVYFFMARHGNNKLYEMLFNNSLKQWQAIDAHDSINGLVYSYVQSMPDILELSLYELENENTSIRFALPLTYNGLRQQLSIT